MTTAEHQPQNLIDSIRAVVESGPSRPAVHAADGTLSYGGLDAASSRIAAGLRAVGAVPGSIVVLFVARGIRLVPAILGIWKVGAAYLPVDPDQPPARLAHLISTSAARVVLTTRELEDDARSRGDLGALTILALDPLGVERGAMDLPCGEDTAGTRAGDSLAYVLPTSGSRGRPKGCMIEDRNVLSLVSALRREIETLRSPGHRIAMVAPHFFDASVQQLAGALLTGNSLHVVPDQARGSGRGLRRYLAEHEITLTDCTPTHLRLLAQEPAPPCPALRELLVGGEQLTVADVTGFLRSMDHRPHLMNVYGLAECCVDSTIAHVDADALPTGGVVPIGAPLTNTKITLLDLPAGVPIGGVAGEIQIGGDGVGRGYLGDETLTAERFALGNDGQRCFRTGDIARTSGTGELEFAGRLDGQVKVRGHRIEVAEVEACIARYASTTGISAGDNAESCQRCLLTSNHPSVRVEGGVCSVCREYDGYRSAVEAYFGTPDEFFAAIIAARERARSDYDVLLLFSGGKDSTYVLYRLVEHGLRVLAFTFDNGYVSPTAFDNIHRITANLGVALEIGGAEKMSAVFAESLAADSTVCSGCFRGLTALSTRLAQDKRIPAVVTGLSRGQILDTKLRPLLRAGIHDPSEIDARLLIHRKVYHARADRISGLLALPVAVDRLADTAFLDYFRYDATTSSEIRNFLATRDSAWAAPVDTGLCSTNCRINEVGIYVHSVERGYHNYAAPLSWDCRIGVTDRESALRELANVVPRKHVTRTLKRLGYLPTPRRSPIFRAAVVKKGNARGESHLCAYYVSSTPVSTNELVNHVAAQLPQYMVPSRFVRVPRLPMTPNGKTDYIKLEASVDECPGHQREPFRSDTEDRLARLWRDALDLDAVGRQDDFFTLGGDSLTATVIASIIESEFHVQVSVSDLYSTATIAHGAAVIDAAGIGAGAGLAGWHVLSDGHAGDGESDVFLVPDVWGEHRGYEPMAQILGSRVVALRGRNWLDLDTKTNTDNNNTNTDDSSGAAPSVESGVESGGESDIEQTARSHADLIAALKRDGRLTVIGWSLGGVVAAQVCRQLSDRGIAVDQLVVVDSMPPAAEYWQDQFTRCRALAERSPGSSVSFAELPEEVALVVGTDRPTSAGQLLGYCRALLPVLRALAGYVPTPPRVAALTVVVAGESQLSNTEVDAWQAAVLTDNFRKAVVPGDHTEVLEARELRNLLAGMDL